MGVMTAKAAAQLAGCSISTLRRYECAWCTQTLLKALMYGCGAIYERCDPVKDKRWPISRQRKLK